MSRTPLLLVLVALIAAPSLCTGEPEPDVELVLGPVSDSGEVNVYMRSTTAIAGFQFRLGL